MKKRSGRKWTTLRKIETPQAGGDDSDASDSPEKEEVVGENGFSGDEEAPRVLIIHGMASTYRLIRDTLRDFTNADSVTTSDPLHGFELAMRMDFQLFIFGMHLEDIEGLLLYEFISKVYASGRGPRRMAPGVVFVREKADPRMTDEMREDVRIKDVIAKPISIERLLQSVSSVLERRDPLAKE